MKTDIKAYAIAGGLSALLLTGAAATAVAAPSMTEPSVLAMSQKVENGHVTLDYAYLPSKGYAVVYGADKNGKPLAEPLGSIDLAAGDHRGVKIKLNSEPAKGTTLWVSLYSDKDGKPGFDKSGDVSFWPNGIPSENRITVQ